MGGVIKKITGKDKSYTAPVETKTSTQAVTQGVVEEESADRKKKGAARTGKKKLQIPTSSNTATTSTGGTGLGTGA